LRYLLPFLVLIAISPLIAQSNSIRSRSNANEMNDQEIVEFARKLLEKQRTNPGELLAGLNRIQNYTFKNKDAPEKEYVLFAQGILEDRTDQPTRASVTFRRFERTWPNSQYMPEVEYTLGRYALDKKGYKEAESRFRKALDSDLPVESKYNIQGLLSWCLLEQNRMEDAIPVVKTLFSIGQSKPDERALVAILEVQCAIKDVDGAVETRNSYVATIQNGSMKTRVNMACGLLLAQSGRGAESAQVLHEVINDEPNSVNADEARLTIATIIADGQLPNKAETESDSAEFLLAKVKTEGLDGNAQERSLFLQIRIASNQKQFDRILRLADKYKKEYRGSSNSGTVQSFRDDTIRTIIQDMIDTKGPLTAIPLLTGENIRLITPQLRSRLVSFFVSKSLPEAAVKIIQASPENEKVALRQLLSQGLSDALPPPQVLTNLNGNLTDYSRELGEIKILLSEKKWTESGIKIGKLKPGTDRINALMTLLRRPMLPYEVPLRLKEAQDWLQMCSETDLIKEPLIIFVADLNMQVNNPRGALDLYPVKPQKENLGWVSLMRATAMVRLGLTEEAKKLLDESASIPEFKLNRQSLANQLKF